MYVSCAEYTLLFTQTRRAEDCKTVQLKQQKYMVCFNTLFYLKVYLVNMYLHPTVLMFKLLLVGYV